MTLVLGCYVTLLYNFRQRSIDLAWDTVQGSESGRNDMRNAQTESKYFVGTDDEVIRLGSLYG